MNRSGIKIGLSHSVAMETGSDGAGTSSKAPPEPGGSSGTDKEPGHPFKPVKVLQRSPPTSATETGDAASEQVCTVNQLPGHEVKYSAGEPESNNNINTVADESRTVEQDIAIEGKKSSEEEEYVEDESMDEGKITSQPGMLTVNDVLMARIGSPRNRTYSAPSEYGSPVTYSKRRNESPPVEGEQPKKSKKELFDLKGLESLLLSLAKQINEQTTVKRETKSRMRTVMTYFCKVQQKYEDDERQRKEDMMSTKDKEVNQFRRRLAATKGIEQVEAILTDTWPKGIFERTQIASGAPASEEATIQSVLVRPENFKEDRNFQKLTEVIPAMDNISEEYLRKTLVVKVTREEAVAIPGIPSSKRVLYNLVYASVLSDMDEMDTADLVNWAGQTKAFAIEAGKKRVEIRIPNDVFLEKTRKVFECSFTGTDVDVIIVPNEQRKSAVKQTNNGSVLIEGLGDSYAEVLKKLRTEVVAEDFGVRVERVNQTSSGVARLSIVELEKGGKEKLGKRIRELIPEKCSVQTSGASKPIIIKDIGVDIELEEVKLAVCKQLSLEASEVRVNNFGKVFRGHKDVTVYVPSAKRAEIVNGRFIKIGWSMCRIRDRIDPGLCNQCQKVGHKTCKEPKAPRRCLTCGGTDHLAKECNNSEHCFTCNVDGHRATSMACPIYKQLVKDARRQNA